MYSIKLISRHFKISTRVFALISSLKKNLATARSMLLGGRHEPRQPTGVCYTLNLRDFRPQISGILSNISYKNMSWNSQPVREYCGAKRWCRLVFGNISVHIERQHINRIINKLRGKVGYLMQDTVWGTAMMSGKIRRMANHTLWDGDKRLKYSGSQPLSQYSCILWSNRYFKWLTFPGMDQKQIFIFQIARGAPTNLANFHT